jgi:hypothetical protein
MSTEQGGPQPTEEELRAAYEAEIKKIRVEQVLLEHVVTTINLGMRRTGLAPGTENERDAEQVSVAVESVRALLPLVEQVAPAQAKPIRDALSQLQLAYVRIGGKPEAGGGDGAEQSAPGGGGVEQPQAQPPQGEESKPGEPGPAQRSGRLWVPGQ